MLKGQNQQDDAARYCVRTEVDGRVLDIGVGNDLAEEILFAERHYAKHGSKIRISDMRTGHTVHRIPGRARAAGAR